MLPSKGGSEHKQFWCTHPGCNKVFNRRDYLERHATNHLKVKPFVCVQCNRHFSRKDLYDNHLTTKRHARVTQEVQLANFENNITQLSQNNRTDQHGFSSGHSELDRKSFGHSESNFTNDSFRSRSNFTSRSSSNNSSAQQSSRGSSSLQANNFPVISGGQFAGEITGIFGDSDIFGLGNPHLLDSYNVDMDEPRDIMGVNMSDASQSSLMSPTHRFSLLNRRTSFDKSPIPHQLPSMYTNPNFSNENDSIERYIQENEMGTQSMLSYDSQAAESDRQTVINMALGPGGLHPDPLSFDDIDALQVIAPIIDRLNTDEKSGSYTIGDIRDKYKSFDVQGLQPEIGFNLAGLELTGQSGDIFPQNNNQPLSSVAISGPLTPMLDTVNSCGSSTDLVKAATGDARYSWFFDDVFGSDRAKFGYDHCYNDMVYTYQTRSREYRAKPNQQASERLVNMDAVKKVLGCANSLANEKLVAEFPNFLSSLSVDRYEEALRVLGGIKPEKLSLERMTEWTHLAFLQIEPIAFLVHPATLDINRVHGSLLAVLTLLGVALSKDIQAKREARKAYSPVFLSVYEALVHLPQDLSLQKLDVPTVSILQAFALLLRYERLILTGNGSPGRTGADFPARYAMNLLLTKVLTLVPRVGEFSKPSKQQPIWTTISSEGYMFHQGANPDDQWRECMLLETVRRIAFFAVFFDTTVELTHQKEAIPDLVSIFALDIHMLVPEPLWLAKSSREFFHVTGNTGIIPHVPFLGLLKSMIRFPRTAQLEDIMPHDHDQAGIPWNMFTLQIVASGLVMIRSRVGGTMPLNKRVITNSVSPNEDMFSFGEALSKFDRQVQARLYRGLDVWSHCFSAAYGDITDDMFDCIGTMSIPLRDSSDPTQIQNGPGVPQFAMMVTMEHLASHIFIHDDLPIIHQVTANIKVWLDNNRSSSLPVLLDYLYMPLYTNWVKTEDARGLISASLLYIAWNHAIGGHGFYRKNMFLSSMLYISIIVVWLNDCVMSDSKEPYAPLRVGNYEFMDDASQYIEALYRNSCGKGDPPRARPVTSILLLGACILYKRKSTKLLVKMLLRLLSVIDCTYSPQELLSIIHEASSEYYKRAVCAKCSILLEDPTGAPADDDSPQRNSHSGSLSSDAYSDDDRLPPTLASHSAMDSFGMGSGIASELETSDGLDRPPAAVLLK